MNVVFSPLTNCQEDSSWVAISIPTNSFFKLSSETKEDTMEIHKATLIAAPALKAIVLTLRQPSFIGWCCFHERLYWGIKHAKTTRSETSEYDSPVAVFILIVQTIKPKASVTKPPN
jgi:hypothetical protein